MPDNNCVLGREEVQFFSPLHTHLFDEGLPFLLELIPSMSTTKGVAWLLVERPAKMVSHLR